MNIPSKEQVLASSNGWVATTLNFMPGLGAGYLYQRRWIPYFVTVVIASAWIILGAVINGEAEPTKTQQIIGIGGLLLISITTMIEAKLAHQKTILAIEEQHKEKPQKQKGGLFR